MSSETTPSPENFGELLTLARSRVAATEIKEVVDEAFDYTPAKVFLKVMLFNVLASIGELVFGIWFLVAASQDYASGWKIGVGVLFAISLFYGRLIAPKSKRPVEVDCADYRIGLACETLGSEDIFTSGNTGDEIWAAVFTFDEDLILNPERLEHYSSLVMRAKPPRPEMIEASAALPESLKAISKRLFVPGIKHPVALPDEVTNGTLVELAEYVFVSATAPYGWVDRVFFPVLEVTDAKGKRHLANLPARYWWSEETDDLPLSFGHMAEAFAEYTTAMEAKEKSGG